MKAKELFSRLTKEEIEGRIIPEHLMSHYNQMTDQEKNKLFQLMGPRTRSNKQKLSL